MSELQEGNIEESKKRSNCTTVLDRSIKHYHRVYTDLIPLNLNKKAQNFPYLFDENIYFCSGYFWKNNPFYLI